MIGLFQRSPLFRTVVIFLAIGVVCLVYADIAITTVSPWREMGRLALGFVTPDFSRTHALLSAIANTIAFAMLGVAFANIFGFALSLLFASRIVRVGCALIRAVHELFWALIFLQIFGLSPLTGILAIGIPYSGIIAKVYAEILEEADQSPLRALPSGTGRVSAFLFAQLPLVISHFKSYSLYRLECGLRSSAVLGFIGLPTLGYHLEAAFRQGYYSEVWALLFLFYFIIATVRIWVRVPLLPVYVAASLWFLDWRTTLAGGNAWRFFTHDIIPAPLRSAHSDHTLAALAQWTSKLITEQAVPGVVATVQLTMLSVVITGMLMMLFYPLISPLLTNRLQRWGGHLLLVMVRSTPEYIIAFVLLQLWGPSMLPAVVALALHNGAIIGHLGGRFTETMKLRRDAEKGLNRYFYEVTPRIYRQMLALLFYRWEVIMRETGILGMLGIGTLGFYIDSAFSDLRFDRAMLLIFITALLNISIDLTSRAVRRALRLQTTPQGL